MGEAHFLTSPSELTPQHVQVLSQRYSGPNVLKYSFGLVGPDARRYITWGLLDPLNDTLGLNLTDADSAVQRVNGAHLDLSEHEHAGRFEHRGLAAVAIFHAAHRVIAHLPPLPEGSRQVV